MPTGLSLSQGYVATVDDNSPAIEFKWSAFVTGRHIKRVYAVRQHYGKTMYLHRFIMCPEDGFDVDHINGDSLDNRIENLRICTRKQNLANNRRSRGVVGFRGVTLDRRRGNQFLARVSGKNVGRYATAEEAARAYDFHAKAVYGDYAKLNF